MIDAHEMCMALQAHNQTLLAALSAEKGMTSFCDDLSSKIIGILHSTLEHVVWVSKDVFIVVPDSSTSVIPTSLTTSFRKASFMEHISEGHMKNILCQHCGRAEYLLLDSGIDADIAVSLCTIAQHQRESHLDFVALFGRWQNLGTALAEVKAAGIKVILLETDQASHTALNGYTFYSIVNQSSESVGIHGRDAPAVSVSLSHVAEDVKAVSPAHESNVITPHAALINMHDTLAQSKLGVHRVQEHYSRLDRPSQEKLFMIVKTNSKYKTSPCRLFHHLGSVCKFPESQCHFIHDPDYQEQFLPNHILDEHRRIINHIRSLSSMQDAIVFLNSLANFRLPTREHFSGTG